MLHAQCAHTVEARRGRLKEEKLDRDRYRSVSEVYPRIISVYRSLTRHSRAGGNLVLNSTFRDNRFLDSRLRGNDGKLNESGREFRRRNFVGNLRIRAS
jgi:hypothetical protein